MSINLRKAARGQPCQVRLPGVCQSGGENETTVLAHLPNMSIGSKSGDLLSSWACAACHDVLDGRQNHKFDRDWLGFQFLKGMERTIRKLYANGTL